MTAGREGGTLHAGQLATLAAVADAIIPRGGAFPLGAADVGVAGRLDRYLNAFNPATRRQLVLLLAAWEFSPLFSRYLKPFSRLSAAERERFVEEAASSRYPWRRIPITALKQLCGLAFGAAPELEAAFGFTGTCVHETPPQKGPRLTPLMYPDLKGNVDERVNACIIGSGAGGAVVAKELAEAGRSVLVVEEGAYFTQGDFHGPPFERVLRTYRDQGATMAYGRPVIPLPLGKAVGGTTVVNSGTCFRTPDKVLRRWESEFGLEGFDPTAMAPIFERVEEILHVTAVPSDIIGKNAEIFDRGVCAFGCPSDAKQAMHLSYLPRAAEHGARIFARCRAGRIMMGAEAGEQRGEFARRNPRRAAVVCGGRQRVSNLHGSEPAGVDHGVCDPHRAADRGELRALFVALAGLGG